MTSPLPSPRLTTERLALRELRLADLRENFFDGALLRHPDLLAALAGPSPLSAAYDEGP
jgi:hypothetical protein